MVRQIFLGSVHESQRLAVVTRNLHQFGSSLRRWTLTRNGSLGSTMGTSEGPKLSCRLRRGAASLIQPWLKRTGVMSRAWQRRSTSARNPRGTLRPSSHSVTRRSGQSLSRIALTLILSILGGSRRVCRRCFFLTIGGRRKDCRARLLLVLGPVLFLVFCERFVLSFFACQQATVFA